MKHGTSHKSGDEAKVSQAYKLLSQTQPRKEPPSAIDQLIKMAATQSIESRHSMTKKRFIVPVSIAASVLLASIVGLNLLYKDTAVLQDTGISADAKKPMFMLQRSKPASVEKMAVQLGHYLQQGDIDKARQLYKKMNYYFPDYQFNADIAERLRAENIQ